MDRKTLNKKLIEALRQNSSSSVGQAKSGSAQLHNILQQVRAVQAAGLLPKDINPSIAAAAHSDLDRLKSKNPSRPLGSLVNRLSVPKQHAVDTLRHFPLDSNIKNMADFRRIIQAMRRVKQQPLMNAIEILDKDQITEISTGGHEQNPPVMIVLKRKGIRIFPDGSRVALYDNKQLGLAVTIPYKGDKFSPGDVPKATTEEIELDNIKQINENLDALAEISKSDKHGTIKFKDGSSMKVHPQVAGVIHQLHGALNDENKQKVERMITHSAGQFNKIADFAASKSKWKIKDK